MRSSLFFTLMSIAGLALAAPATTTTTTLARRETDMDATDRLLFSSSMAVFQTARITKNPPSLDWVSDGCSKSPDNPLGFDFHESCQRHDFGYHNYKAQGRFTEETKQRLDLAFKADMYTQCFAEWWTSLCHDFADIYYAAVHEFGKKPRSAEFVAAEARFRRRAEEALRGVPEGRGRMG